MQDFYSSVVDVIKYTGITYEKLDLDNEPALDTLLESWLKQIASLINNNRNRNYAGDLVSGEDFSIELCEELWTADASGVVVSLQEHLADLDGEFELPKPDEEISCVRFSLPATIDNNVLIAHKSIDTDKQDLSLAKIMKLYIQVSGDIEAGKLAIILSAKEDCSTILKTLSIPSLVEDEWKHLSRYLGQDSTLKEVKGIGLKHISGMAGMDIYIDMITGLKVPEGIHNIAKRMCGNMIALALSRRESGVYRVDDWNVKIALDQIFTPEIKKDLYQYPAKPNFRFTRVVGMIDDQRDIPISEIS